MALDIQKLGESLLSYKEHLNDQLKVQTTNQELDHPVRTIGEHATLEHRRQSALPVMAKYSLIDTEVSSAQLMTPVFFDESKHVDTPFVNSTQKFRFLKEMHLSVPIDIIRFCPGGSEITTVGIVRVQEDRTEAHVMTQGARLLQQMQPRMKEFHTRMQKREFKTIVNSLSRVSPALTEFLYRYLTLDASAAANPVMQHRMHLISMGQTGIIADLRTLNRGRPGVYDPFFEKLEEVVEEATAADDRRHNVAHLSEWISLKELCSKAAERCTDGIPVPSVSLVRLQFIPRNPYAHSALNFTSRIPVQYKIQKRQLRVQHPDDHFCAAQLKYLKEKAVEMRGNVAFLCCDDKAKVPVGEPNAPVSTGVRGKMTIAPVSTTLGALDHDMTKASLTPSVVLRCEIPESSAKSFVRGKVTTVVNDAVFQSSNPFRHAAIIVKLAEHDDAKVMMKFTDGGTDQRNNLESVKCANICIFKELNLDMLVHARCAPGHSYTNPAERVMSVLNLGLQNCSLERVQCDDESESNFKKCGSMAEIRAFVQRKPEIQTQWKESVEPIQSLVRNRFMRLRLKDEPIGTLDPASDQDIDIVKRHLRELFPDLDIDRLQKVNTSKVKAYTEWVKNHCRERHYCFQIRKCADPACCLPTHLERSELTWLPDPVLDSSGEHYEKYAVVRDRETTEKDRPSLKKPAVEKPIRSRRGLDRFRLNEGPVEVMAVAPRAASTGTEAIPGPSQANTMQAPVDMDTSLFTAQNARATVLCIECRKPRVIYSKQKLSERHNMTVTLALSEFDYSCGAPLLPITCPLARSVMCRAALGCATPVEVPYYTSAIGRIDVCAFCGAEEAVVDGDLKKKFKTVLPLCIACRNEGKEPIVHRPFGSAK